MKEWLVGESLDMFRDLREPADKTADQFKSTVIETEWIIKARVAARRDAEKTDIGRLMAGPRRVVAEEIEDG